MEQTAAAIDALWDYNNPEASEARFRKLLDRAADTDDPEYLAQVLTQLARSQGLQRRFDDAHATLDSAEPLLNDDTPLARVRLALERGRVFNSAGEPARARPYFEEALQMATGAGEEFYAVDAAHMLAIVAPPQEALEWNRRALDLARNARDERARRWRGSLLNNLGWAYHAAGDYEQALAAFQEALQARRETQQPREERIARWAVARALRSLHRYEEALDLQREVADAARASGDRDPYIEEELGECLLALGRTAEAIPHLTRAYHILSVDPWLAEHEPARIERLGALSGLDTRPDRP